RMYCPLLPIRLLAPDTLFPYTTLFRSLTVGAIFVMWLGEQITERGVGNGMSLLIFFSIIEGFPAATARTWEAFMVGEIGAFSLRSEEHTSELQSRENLVCRPLPRKNNG